jgi:preprotein translocase subunit SecF
MELIKPNTNIDFIGKRHICITLSMLAILATVVLFFVKSGFNYGIDFVGGTLVQLKFQKEISIESVRDGLHKMNMGDSDIQHFGSRKDVLIRTGKWTEDLKDVGESMRKKLKEEFPDNTPEVERVEMVGPKVGSDLREKALLSLFYSMVGILIYVALRFELKFGVAAILATLHDILIMVAAFLITGKEFNLTIVAAFLTIIGYSLNDTVVVFDRIRENLRKAGKKDLLRIINDSVNQTLSRTLLTSGLTFLVVIALFFFGGEVIHDFAYALLVGIVVGTYSSIYIASPCLVIWENLAARKKKQK